MLINTVGPFAGTSEPVVRACVSASCHYVDVTAEQGFVEWAIDEIGPKAVGGEVSVVPASGLDYAPGDLLATVAAGAVDAVREVHVAYYVPGALSMLRRSSAGTLRTLVSVIGRPMTARVAGERREEGIGQARRLAWFPRPVGPRHAAGAPGIEALTLPARFGTVDVARTYLAMPSWQAEIAQFAGSLGRLKSVTGFLSRRTAGVRRGPDETLRQSTRWACVAEAEGTNGIARAWAYGHDIYGFTAASSVLIAQRVAAGGCRSGVIGPADVGDPTGMLDELADITDLRWSLVRPR